MFQAKQVKCETKSINCQFFAFTQPFSESGFRKNPLFVSKADKQQTSYLPKYETKSVKFQFLFIHATFQWIRIPE